MERAQPTGIAKWGAACAPCAAAKAKCLRSSNVPGAKCDRCQRLYKDCVSQVHKPRKKRQVKPSKTAQLEERLNGLVEILKASGELPMPSDIAVDSTCIPSEEDGTAPAASNKETTPGSASGASTPSDSTFHASGAHGASCRAVESNTIPPTWHSHAPPACVCRPQFKGQPPPPLPDEELLAIYRTELCPVWPFVVVPSAMTATELASSRPFLMQAIRAVAHYRSLPNMQYNSYICMRYLSEQMLMRASRSLDLLLGIIVFVGWYHKHCLMHAQLNNTVHLAFSLLADLGLNRNPQLAERTRLLVMHPVEPDARTLEERRAMLGVWYLSSILHVGFSRLESLTYSKYVQECVQTIESAREYESDGVLTVLVRTQRLTAEIHALQTGELSELTPSPSLLPRASHAAYVAAFQSELDRLRASIPRGFKSNKTIESSLATAQLHLYEPPLLTAQLLQSLSAPVSVSTAMQGNNLSNLDVLYHANTALKRWFDTFLGMPVSACLTLPLSLSAQIIYAITMLSRWAKLTAPWLAQRAGYSSPPNNRVTPNASRPSTDARCGKTGEGEEVSGSGPTAGLNMLSSIGSPHQASYACGSTSQFYMHDVPPVIAALNAHLAATPGLALDVPGVLESLAGRFEAVITDLDQNNANQTRLVDGGAEQCTGPGAPITSIWELGVRKIRITRAKLEKITELAAQGAGPPGAGSREGGPDADTCADGGCGKECPDQRQASLHPKSAAAAALPHHSLSEPSAGSPLTPSIAGPPGIGAIPGIFGAAGGGSAPVGSNTPAPASPLPPQPNFGGPGIGSVFELAAQGQEWMKNSYWANSGDVFDGLDPNLWWDGGDGVDGPGVGAGVMDMDVPGAMM